jgi:hypothetical protein
MAKIFKTNAETKLATAKKLGIALGVVEVRARNYPPLIQPRRQAPVACTDVRVPGMCAPTLWRVRAVGVATWLIILYVCTSVCTALMMHRARH